MLKERFIDGVTDSQLRRELRRFSLEHPDAKFQDFRQEVLKWAQDQKPTSDALQASERVELQARTYDDKTALTQKPEQSQDFLKMLAAQQELLESQQKQLNLLTDLVKQKDPPRQTAYRQDRGRGGPAYGRRPGFRGRGAGRGGAPRRPLTCFNCQGEGHFARDCPNATTQPGNNGATNEPLNM